MLCLMGLIMRELSKMQRRKIFKELSLVQPIHIKVHSKIANSMEKVMYNQKMVSIRIKECFRKIRKHLGN